MCAEIAVRRKYCRINGIGQQRHNKRANLFYSMAMLLKPIHYMHCAQLIHYMLF